MLASNPCFFWGTTEISWLQMGGVFYFTDISESKLGRAISYATAFGQKYDTAFRTFVTPWTDIMSQTSWAWILRIENMSRPDQLSASLFPMNQVVDSDLFSGYSVMKNLRMRRSSTSHDHVYAFYGVLEMIYRVTPPSANYERPLDLVYLDFFVYVTGCHNLFLHLIADSGLHQTLPGGPSWLPDWSTALENRTWLSPGYIHKMGSERMSQVIKRRHMNTPVGEIEMICVVEGRVLKVSATFHSKITFFSTLEEQYWQDFLAVDGTSRSNAADNNEFREQNVTRLAVTSLLYDWLKASPSTRDFIKNPLWATMSVFGAPSNEHLMPEILGGQHWLVIGVGKLLVYVQTALNESWFSDPEQDRTIATLLLVKEFLKDPEALQVMQEIYQSMLGKRSFLTTEDGEIGSGPSLMKVGDRIAQIAGVGVPMLLRPHEPVDVMGNYYSVVGPVCFSTKHMEPVSVDWAKRETIALV